MSSKRIVRHWLLSLSLISSDHEVSSLLHHNSPHDEAEPHLRPKNNGDNWLWTKTSKIVMGNKPFLFLSILFQTFCYSIGKMTNTMTKCFPKWFHQFTWLSMKKRYCMLLKPQSIHSFEIISYGIGWNSILWYTLLIMLNV